MKKLALESILKQHAFLQGLDRKHLKLLEGCVTNEVFKGGEFIFREGKKADKFYLLREGHVAVEIPGAERGPIVIETLGPGDVLGWSWLFSPYRWNFDAKVVKVTRAFALDARCIREKCERDHDFGFELMKRFGQVIIDRLHAARLQILDVYGKRQVR